MKTMEGGRLGENTGIREELIRKACSLALKAHKAASDNKLFVVEKSRGSAEVIFCFGGSWSVGDWFTKKPFGETKISLDLFPSLRSIGNDQIAVVNEAFLKKFQLILESTTLRNEVEKAVTGKMQIVFTGHSSGGPLAILTTIWFLEKYLRAENNQIQPLCMTFGSALVGDRIFSHAINRENWSSHFVHFIMRSDIVPRIFLCPLSSIERELQPILNFFHKKSTYFNQEPEIKPHQALSFFSMVLRNASSVTSHAACKYMECTNLLLEKLTNFIELSPYRPFGTNVFCTKNGRLIVLKNPDAVFQMLFYSLQLSSESEGKEFAQRSLMEHFEYQIELEESLGMQDMVHLDGVEGIPLFSNRGAASELATSNIALNDLGLSTTARLCVRAAGELEKQKLRNQDKIDGSSKRKIKEAINLLEKYHMDCELRKTSYYDAFKLQKNKDDFEANVKRQELAGYWDEVLSLLKTYQLPDEFECREEWVEIGTRYRRLVEPLDIANYYRHSLNENTGPYMGTGRPARYKYTQRWREHALNLPLKSSLESCFWAEVEELCQGKFEEMKERVLHLEGEISKWVCDKEIGMDVFSEGSTFVKWWRTLPYEHRIGSRVARFIDC